MKTRKVKHSVDPISCLNHDDVCKCMNPQPTPKAEHTPGPWEQEDGGYRIVGNWHGQRSTIAFVDKAYGEPYRSETLANARLIAAAPELLEVVKRFESLLKDEKGFVNHSLMVKAQELIAKAEGK